VKLAFFPHSAVSNSPCPLHSLCALLFKPPVFIHHSAFIIYHFPSKRALTKIRTYGLISRVSHGATVISRIRAAASSAGAGGKLRWDGGQHSTVGLRCCAAGSVAPRQLRPTASSGRCGGSATKSKIENGRMAFLPHEPIPLNLHQIGGLYHFASQRRLSCSRFEPFRGKSTQLPFHEQVIHRNELLSVKPSQG